jgi:hypothetical protein
MDDRRHFKHLLGKVMDFKPIGHAKGVQNVQTSWQFSQQLTDPTEHAAMAAELAEFFETEVLRIEGGS